MLLRRPATCGVAIGKANSVPSVKRFEIQALSVSLGVLLPVTVTHSSTVLPHVTVARNTYGRHCQIRIVLILTWALAPRCLGAGVAAAASLPFCYQFGIEYAALALRRRCAGVANANDNDSHCDLGRGRACATGPKQPLPLRLAKSNF